MTSTLLFQLPIRRRRDVLTARQRGRQVAALLGFSAAEQTRIAAAVFELAWQTLQQTGRAVLHFELGDDALHVVPYEDAARFAREPAGPLLRLEQRLPLEAACVARDDIPFVAEQLLKLTPVNSFDEIQRLNQELLRTMLELQECKERLAEDGVSANAKPQAAA